MAFSTSTNNASTPLTDGGPTAHNMSVSLINPADWTPTETSRDRVVFINRNSDNSAPNHIRIERKRVSNAYDGSGIVPNYQLPNRSGTKLYIGVDNIVSTSDSTNPTTRLEYPVKAGLSFTCTNAPLNLQSYVNVWSTIAQLLGLFAPNSVNNAGSADLAANLANYLNGSLDFRKW